MSKGPWKKKKAQPKVTVESARITGSVIIKTPTRAELLQERIDILVAQHKDATTQELAELWKERENASTPLTTQEFFSMLRWPPGVAKPHWADPPKPLSKSAALEYDGPRTPLVNDLLRKMAERPKNRPTGRVDYGNKSEPGEKD